MDHACPCFALVQYVSLGTHTIVGCRRVYWQVTAIIIIIHALLVHWHLGDEFRHSNGEGRVRMLN